MKIINRKEFNIDYKSAQELISEYYDLRRIDDDSCEIVIDKMLDDFNMYFICLLRGKNGDCFLSDYAKTCEIFDLPEEELKALAEENNLTFNDFYIKKTFNSIDDLDDFITFLDELSGNDDYDDDDEDEEDEEN